QETLIGPSILGRRSISSVPGWYPDDDFDRVEGNQLHSLAAAAAVAGQGMPAGQRLPHLVVTQLLLQAGRNGHQRRYPMRLLRLDFRHARKPIAEIIRYRV